MKPYTYLIGWSKLDVYYYGVRYARDCCPTDLFRTYFTSSSSVKNFINIHGLPDIVEVRRTFSCPSEARKWETKVLQRMHVKSDKRFLNKNEAPAPPVFVGEEHPNKLPENRKKLSESALKRKYDLDWGRKISEAKLKRSIIQFFLKRKYKQRVTKGLQCKCLKYRVFILNQKPKLKYSIAILTKICETKISRAPYPKGIKRQYLPKKKISEFRKGKRWFYNPSTGVNIFCNPSESTEGFIPGMCKNTPNNNTPEVRAKIAAAIKECRKTESLVVKKQRVEKWKKSIRNENI